MMRDSVFEIRFVFLKMASILLAPGDFWEFAWFRNFNGRAEPEGVASRVCARLRDCIAGF
jgi:hypothetical protein